MSFIELLFLFKISIHLGNDYFFFYSQVCETKQILVNERDGETSLEYSVPLKSFEFKFQRAQQSKKLVVILRLLQVDDY